MGKYARTEGMGSGILHQVCQVSKIHEVGLELLWRNLLLLSRIRDNKSYTEKYLILNSLIKPYKLGFLI